MDFDDENSPFADLPRYPIPPEAEPVEWMDTAAENFAHAGPTLIGYGLLAVMAGTLLYGSLLFGLCGWFFSLSVAVMIASVVVIGPATWRR